MILEGVEALKIQWHECGITSRKLNVNLKTGGVGAGQWGNVLSSWKNIHRWCQRVIKRVVDMQLVEVERLIELGMQLRQVSAVVGDHDLDQASFGRMRQQEVLLVNDRRRDPGLGVSSQRTGRPVHRVEVTDHRDAWDVIPSCVFERGMRIDRIANTQGRCRSVRQAGTGARQVNDDCVVCVIKGLLPLDTRWRIQITKPISCSLRAPLTAKRQSSLNGPGCQRSAFVCHRLGKLDHDRIVIVDANHTNDFV